jgi:hypothetical protein
MSQHGEADGRTALLAAEIATATAPETIMARIPVV